MMHGSSLVEHGCRNHVARYDCIVSMWTNQLQAIPPFPPSSMLRSKNRDGGVPSKPFVRDQILETLRRSWLTAGTGCPSWGLSLKR